ncbi:MAG TPA: hypothetical protein VFK59_00850 [Actinomycetota bacterium]|nr:hypothetical protein [Actinomycetota bacterium]
MSEKVLVTVELRFTTEDDPQQLGERVRESVSQIVGRENLEEFRVRVLPLAPPKRPRSV